MAGEQDVRSDASTSSGRRGGAFAHQGRWAPTTVRDALLLVLAFASGCNDAVVYLSLGQVFTSNMTGNTVLLGIALAQAQWLAALRASGALAGYVAGVALTTAIIARHVRPGPWPAVITTALAVEFFCLLSFTVWGTLLGPSASHGTLVYPLIVLSAIAMGIQSTGVRALGVASISTTYITGTWTGLISSLIVRLPPLRHARAAHDAEQPTSATGLQGAIVGTYILAAVVGAAARLRWHLTALAIPCAAVALVVVVARGAFGGEE